MIESKQTDTEGNEGQLISDVTLFDFKNPLSRRRLLDHITSLAAPTVVGGLSYGQLLRERVDPKEAVDGDLYDTSSLLSIDGKLVRLIGDKHTFSNYFKHKEDINLRVSSAPFIVLEWFPASDRKLALPNVTDQQLSQADAYFGAIARTAALMNKDFVIVDPFTTTNSFLESFVGLGIAVNMLGVTGPELVERALKKKLKRRSLLKLLPIIPSLINLASWADVGRALRDKFEELGVMDDSNLTPEEKADLLGWSLTDFRDLRISQGIHTVAKLFGEEIAEQQEVPVFMGYRHLVVKEYVLRPDLAEKKRKVYAHHDIVASNFIRRYHYDQTSNSWQEVFSQPY